MSSSRAPRGSRNAPDRWRFGGVLSVALVVALVFAQGLALAGCEEERVVEGPEDVVRRLITVLQGVHGDAKSGEAAVALLWEPARQNLAERARRAAAASGYPVKPGEMLAPSWFSLQLVPRSYASRVDGDWAEVTVRGDDPAQGQFRIRCVREENAWRVALELPPLTPIRKRAGDIPEP